MTMPEAEELKSMEIEYVPEESPVRRPCLGLGGERSRTLLARSKRQSTSKQLSVAV